MTPAAFRTTRLARDERRAQILACARRLFSERHFGAVSTTEIARAAGVARGLIHHYFGTKRELYLEAVRSMLSMPLQPVPTEVDGRDPEQLLGEGVDRWLELLARNRETWIAARGAQGFGRDPDVEAILEEAREGAVDQVIEALRPGTDPAAAPAELRGVARAYAGLAEATSLEWLQHGRLTRPQARALLYEAFVAIFRQVLDAVERAGEPGPQQKAIPA
ncbi:MAG: TetR/AcrR family transcriptional regulator [Actinomycetota bacterium]|jgi:AcrR family transcriptional regulator|nr:TetR/AcrR family transcriptional regulator [Actinomycetota bacterium]MDQ3319165.1 TetR/AcrR family transcriptional regulator [Actinomycetota bacterium]MDQ3355122.1 TetR/AcrR family transcriptional regulator [Actinomycetota bacterium]